MDLLKITTVGVDGYHLIPDSHQNIAEAVEANIKSMKQYV